MKHEELDGQIFTFKDLEFLTNLKILGQIEINGDSELKNRIEELSMTEHVEVNHDQYNLDGDFYKGQVLKVKDGISSRTHDRIEPYFVEEMDRNKTIVVEKILDLNGWVVSESNYNYHPSWLEPDKSYEDPLRIFKSITAISPEDSVFLEELEENGLIKINQKRLLETEEHNSKT